MVDRKSSWEISHQRAESQDADWCTDNVWMLSHRHGLVQCPRLLSALPHGCMKGKAYAHKSGMCGPWPVAFWKAHVELCRDGTWVILDRLDPDGSPPSAGRGVGRPQVLAADCSSVCGAMGRECATRMSLGTGDTRGRNVVTEKTLILRCMCVGEGPGRELEF